MSRPAAPPDPPAQAQLSVSALDFLLIELVPLAQRTVSQLAAQDAALPSRAAAGQNLFSPRRPPRRRAPPQTQQATSEAAAGATDPASTAVPNGEDEQGQRESVFHRLEGQGYRVGQALAERFSPTTPRPTTHLDSIKFICRDLWTALYAKQIDNLKTNHRGTFVLTDTRFPALARMSPDRRVGATASETALRAAQPYLWFHCGVVRGALHALGMDVVVNAETQELPVAVFQVRVVGAKP